MILWFCHWTKKNLSTTANFFLFFFLFLSNFQSRNNWSKREAPKIDNWIDAYQYPPCLINKKFQNSRKKLKISKFQLRFQLNPSLKNEFPIDLGSLEVSIRHYGFTASSSSILMGPSSRFTAFGFLNYTLHKIIETIYEEICRSMHVGLSDQIRDTDNFKCYNPPFMHLFSVVPKSICHVYQMILEIPLLVYGSTSCLYIYKNQTIEGWL